MREIRKQNQNQNGRIEETLNYYKILVFSTLLANINIQLPFLPYQILGFGFTGYSWILVLVVSLFNLIRNGKTLFPITLWIPWLLVVLVYMLINLNSVSIQGSVQFFVPVLVGMVSGTLKYNLQTLKSILKYFGVLVTIIIVSNTILSYVRLGMVGYGSATDAHIVAIAGIILIGLFYSTKKYKYLVYYGLIVIVPIAAVTRMGIFVIFIIPLLHFYKVFSFKKFFLVLLLIPIAIYVYHLPAIQEKMFYDNSTKDISYNNDNLNTSGRKAVNDLMIKEYEKNSFWGNGARSDYFILKKNGYQINETHNDYLQLLNNYGIFGTSMLFLTFIIQFIFIFQIKKNTKIERILCSIYFTMMFVLLMFMSTDTIVRGTFSYMNYFFAIIGIIYSIHNNNVMTINLTRLKKI